jgi:hypothetical protein
LVIRSICCEGQDAAIHLVIRGQPINIVKRGCDDSLREQFKKWEKLRSVHQFWHDLEDCKYTNRKVIDFIKVGW